MICVAGTEAGADAQFAGTCDGWGLWIGTALDTTLAATSASLLARPKI